VYFNTVVSTFLTWYDICMYIDMNTLPSHTIRHPVDIPLEVKAIAVGAWQQGVLDDSRCAELAFHFPMMIAVGALLSVRVPSVNAQTELRGQVIWLAQSVHGFVIGMSFQTEAEAFRMRMIEQLCHIEDYRQQVFDAEGRELNPEQAASEWIDHHAAAFPALAAPALYSGSAL